MGAAGRAGAVFIGAAGAVAAVAAADPRRRPAPGPSARPAARPAVLFVVEGLEAGAVCVLSLWFLYDALTVADRRQCHHALLLLHSPTPPATARRVLVARSAWTREFQCASWLLQRPGACPEACVCTPFVRVEPDVLGRH